MDFQILLDNQYPAGGLTFTKNLDIRSDIYSSINIRKGSWFARPDFGCDLYKIRKVTSANILLAKQYIEEALAWLVTTGRAKTIDVLVEADDMDISRINIKVTATQQDGLIITYQQYRPVGLGVTTDYIIRDGQYVAVP